MTECPKCHDLLDLISDFVAQDCVVTPGEDGVCLDSMGLSPYADGLRELAKAGRVIIIREGGRRVLARWATKEEKKP